MREGLGASRRRPLLGRDAVAVARNSCRHAPDRSRFVAQPVRPSPPVEPDPAVSATGRSTTGCMPTSELQSVHPRSSSVTTGHAGPVRLPGIHLCPPPLRSARSGGLEVGTLAENHGQNQLSLRLGRTRRCVAVPRQLHVSATAPCHSMGLFPEFPDNVSLGSSAPQRATLL